MIVLPAIDLLDGACVRLTKGDYAQVEHYSNDAVEVALGFEEAGAKWIHVVDLNAARDGSPLEGREGRNRKMIRKIAAAVACRIEVGGGVRTLRDVEQLLDAGADRLVLGTVLAKDPEEVKHWCLLYPGMLWAGIDADQGTVKVSGWQSEARLQDTELAAQVPEMQLGGIVYTSIGRDGTLEGPDIEGTNRIAEVSGLPVILSGGIGSMEDIRRVSRRRHAGIEGLIVGKAIYQEHVDLRRLFADEV